MLELLFFILSSNAWAGAPELEAVARLNLGINADGTELRPCTGFVADGSRLLTCEHCVMDAEDCAHLEASFFDEAGAPRAFARCARLVATDRIRDVALVELERVKGALPAALRIALEAAKPGRAVRLTGFPLHARRVRTVTSGKATASPNPWSVDQFHTAGSGPGNSGSPLVDAATSEVVSLHCAASGTGSLRLGYGAPAAVLRSIAR